MKYAILLVFILNTIYTEIPSVRSLIIPSSESLTPEKLTVIGVLLDHNNLPVPEEPVALLLNQNLAEQSVTDKHGMCKWVINLSTINGEKSCKLELVSLKNNTLVRCAHIPLPPSDHSVTTQDTSADNKRTFKFTVIKDERVADTALYVVNGSPKRDLDVNFNSNVNNVNVDINPPNGSKVSKSGDTMTGALQLPAGSAASPSLNFTGSTTSGLSANAGALSLNTNGVERFRIANNGALSVPSFTSSGLVHNDGAGNLTSSLLASADIANGAITDAKLATIVSAGKIANSATTATSANNPNTIVSRNASGNFNANTINASLILPAGSLASPSMRFSTGTTTGLASLVSNVLSFITTSTERLTIGQDINTLAPLIYHGIHADKATQQVVPVNNGNVLVDANTSILILKNVPAVINFGVVFPPNPKDGQFFTILQGSTGSTSLVNTGGLGGAAIINPVTVLNPSLAPNATRNPTSVTYYYSLSANAWYRL